MDHTTNELLDRVLATLNQIDQRLDAQDQRLERLEARLDSQEPRTGQLEADMQRAGFIMRGHQKEIEALAAVVGVKVDPPTPSGAVQ